MSSPQPAAASVPSSIEESSMERLNLMLHQVLDRFGREQQIAIERQVNAAVENVVRHLHLNSSTAEVQSPSVPSPGAVNSNEAKSSSDSFVSLAPISARIKISPPSTFNGSRSVNVDNWLNEMKQYLLLGSVNDEPTQVLIAASYLKEIASQWWQGRKQLPNPPTSWFSFSVSLKERFQPLAASRTARSQLRNLRQSNMSVSDYSSKFSSLVQLISDMSQADQVELFIYGLRAAISREVDLREPKTLYEAMTAAQKVESLLDNRRTYIHSSSNDSRPFSSSTNFGPSNSSSSASFASSSSSSSTAMELGNVTAVEHNDYEVASEEVVAEKECEYQRYLEEGDDFEPNYELWSDLEQRNQDEENVEQLQAMQQRSQRRTAPYMPTEEFTRCMKLRLCLRCKKPGHIARNCPLRPQSQQQHRQAKRNF
jgi:hypothetical protein